MKPGNWAALTLVNRQPTETRGFGAALPIGNGRLGAKFLGGVAQETIYLNDTTLWSGGPEHYESPKAHDALIGMRAALVAGDYKKAHTLARDMEGKDNESYEPLATLQLSFPGHEQYTDYTNSLDLNTAILTTKYKVNGVVFTREAFASYPAQVVVLRLSGDRKSEVHFTVTLDTQLHNGTRKVSGKEIDITGRAPSRVDNYERRGIVEWDPKRGMLMDSRLRIVTEGGSVQTGPDSLTVTGADAALLIFSAATSFNGFDRDPATQGKDPAPIAQAFLEKATERTYPQLLEEHVKDYQSLFRRLWVEINDDPLNKHALSYQYARYILIASSRPGNGAPRNEQGIWNRDIMPLYASNFTLNENPEKYYSLAEPGNLSETTAPLIGFIGDLAKNGAITAKVNYGFHGWVAHHNADIWAMSTMATGDPAWAWWPMGGTWLCQNLWEHYAFGLDKNYLRQDAYPVMRGAAEFALDLLVTNKNGFLVTSPSSSPENSFKDPVSGERVAIAQGSTMDMALIRQLFQNTIEASRILNIDAPFRDRLQATLAKLLPYQVGSQGQLQEWAEDFQEWEPHHRHVSHLVAVWPLGQITPGQPQLFAASRKSLELRGSGGFHPDKASMWAWLLDGDKTIAAQQTNIPSLYDAPFAGFAEMLLQSQSGVLNLLPALPSSWGKGKILGLRARGGYEVDLEWDNQHLTHARIRSYQGTTPRVAIENRAVDMTDRRVQFEVAK
jgi:alpha-L-fucosidase 2